ncbi:actin cortical patch SUR7/pH-response regulator pali [Astrocystis sublimbata]|nr:actin cortical patch SUR7/pH-response regulator pali [Astrocystis sublimbata]
MPVPRHPGLGLLLPPVIFSLVGFVLALIVLLAGTGPQQESMEPYHIIAVNLSNFGHDLVPTKTDSDPKPSETGKGGFLDNIIDGAQDLGEDITDGINNITDGLADDLIKDLGISQWYSLHIMTACEGMFAPDASNPGSYNLTNCTSQEAGLRLNLSEVLDHEIEAGPLKVNLNQLPIPEKVQDAIDLVNNALLALLVIYALAGGLAGLSFLVGLATLIFLRQKVSKPVVWANTGLAGTSAFILLIGSAIVTYVNNKGVEEINKAGKDVGISGIKGTKLITLTWITFGLMAFTALYWGVALLKYARRWVIIEDGFRRRNEKAMPMEY